MRLFQGRFQRLHAPIEIGHGLLQLRAPAIMGRRVELTLEFSPRQTKRLELAERIGIAHDFRAPLGTLACKFFHALLNPRIGIDQSLSGITHACDCTKG